MASAADSQRVEHWVDTDLTPGTGEQPDGTERIGDGGLRPHPLRDPDHRAHKAALAQALFGVASEPVRIGRFRVLARLGEGGMGVVFAGHDDELDRRVAIKLLHVDGDLGESRSRLLREAQALARLSHPNVVGLFEVGESQGRLFVAMEHVQGETLHAWIRGQASPRPWREVLDVFLAAGRGLAAAHVVGLVHRDFKPGNVMLGADGRVRVLDFGLARALHHDDAPRMLAATHGAALSVLDTPLTMTGSLIGTPAYMAPEQLHGGRCDPRSDQFSFCVALFEALYGARPHVGATEGELFKAIERGEIRRPPAGSRVPAWLHAAVVRGLAHEPAARWPSMPALIAELTRDRHARRRRWTLAAVIGGLGLVPLGLGLAAGVERLEHGARQAACELRGDEVSDVYDLGTRAGLLRRLGPNPTAAEIEGLGDAASTVAQRAVHLRDERVALCMSDPEGYVHPQHLLEQITRADRCFEKQRDDLRTLLEVARQVDPVTAGLILPTETFAADDCRLAATLHGKAPEYPDELAARGRWQAIHAEVMRGRLEIAAGRPGGAEAILVAALAGAAAIDAQSLQLEAARALTHAHFAAGHRRAAWSVFEAALAASPAIVEVRHNDPLGSLPLQLALGAASGKPRVTTALLMLDGSKDKTSIAASEGLTGVLQRGASPLWRGSFLRMHSIWYGRSLPGLTATAQLRASVGDFEAAEEYARNTLAASSFHAHDPGRTTDLLLVLAQAQQGLGRHAQAEASLQRALTEANADPGARNRLPQIHLALAELALAGGALDVAERELAVTASLATEAEADDDLLIPALTLALGRLHAARGDLDGAEAVLQRARKALLASHGAARRLLVHAEVELGRLALARADLPTAASALDTAIRLNEALVGETHVSHAPILLLQSQVQVAQGQQLAAHASIERARASIAGQQVAASLRAALAG